MFLKRTHWILILCVVLLTLLLSLRVLMSPNTVITYDGTKFSPETVVVPLGGTVVFKNQSSHTFWPASNLHPSHSLYSDFDSKEEIEPSKSWSFTFSQSGVWKFHDHLRSIAEGSVIVLEENGAKPVTKLECNDKKKENEVRCWEQKIQFAIDTGGIEEAFVVFSELYNANKNFAFKCHDIAHIIGEEAYILYTEDVLFSLSAKTQYCGYGFFHGFMETLIANGGSMEEARSFCSYVDKLLADEIPAASGACYHGIGHGATDGSNPSDWGSAASLSEAALLLCEKVGENDHSRHICGTGVFHAIASAYIDGQFGLTASTRTVYDLCLSVLPLFKLGCYDHVNTLIVWLADYDFAESLRIVSTIPEKEYYQEAIFRLGATFGRLNLPKKNYEEVIQLCYEFDQSSSGSCISGFAGGLVETGPPEQEHVLAVEFCSLPSLGVIEKKQCFEKVLFTLQSIYSKQEVSKICDLVSEKIDITNIESCGI